MPVQEAKLDGKAAAVEATNAYLQLLFLTEMQFGALEQLNPELTAASDWALRCSRDAAHSRLQNAADMLQTCADNMRCGNPQSARAGHFRACGQHRMLIWGGV